MAGKTSKGEVGTEIRLRHIKDWQSSGLTKEAYCQKSGVTINQLNYWQKAHGGKQAKPSQKLRPFARVAIAPSADSLPAAPASLRLVVGRAFVEIRESADPVWAARLIAAIGGNA